MILFILIVVALAVAWSFRITRLINETEQEVQADLERLQKEAAEVAGSIDEILDFLDGRPDDDVLEVKQMPTRHLRLVGARPPRSTGKE